MIMIALLSLCCWISDKNSRLWTCFYLERKQDCFLITEETMNLRGGGECGKKTSHCTKVSFFFHFDVIQNIFVRIKNNVSSEEDPCGGVSTLLFTHVFVSFHTCMYVNNTCLQIQYMLFYTGVISVTYASKQNVMTLSLLWFVVLFKG